jgi:hypothetical protein
VKSFCPPPVKPTYHYALAQIFGASLLNSILKEDYEAKLQSLLQHCGLQVEDWTLVNAFNAAYSYLAQYYRCEYVYKNEIANQLLLARHQYNSATLLRELASDQSIADIVIVNGHTVAYEVKTELDNFDRLASQTTAYRSLYDSLYVVTHARAISTLEQRLTPEIGLMVLDEQAQIHEVRAAAIRPDLFEPAKAVLTLRQSELVKALEKRTGKFPRMGTASVLTYCHTLYLSLSREEARQVFYEALKSRRPAEHQYQLIVDCEKSLKMMLLGRDLPRRLCSQVRQRLGLAHTNSIIS